MVIDTSALIALLRLEPEADAFARRSNLIRVVSLAKRGRRPRAPADVTSLRAFCPTGQTRHPVFRDRESLLP